MIRVRIFVFIVCVLGGGVLSAAAQDVSKLSEAERKQVNEWMAERAETMIGAHKLEVEVQEAWGNLAYSSPEVDALRARYRELQAELTRTQFELQKKVKEIPAIQEKVRQIDEAKKKELDLAKRIEEKTGEKR